MQIGVLDIDFAERTASRGGEPVLLTTVEWELLELLLQDAGKPLPARYLLGEVWGAAFQQDEAYLATWIWRLRQKIEPDPRHPVFLKTVMPLGYRLDAETVTCPSNQPSGEQSGR